MKDIKVGQRWWVPAYEEVWVVESRMPEEIGHDVYVKTPAGHNVWVGSKELLNRCTLLPDIVANQVYQHGDELFVTLDATLRMRNLRTGLTIRPRGDFDKHFKYLGEMPQVGQVWVGNLTGLPKTIQSIKGDTFYVELGNGTEDEIRLRALFSNHYLRPGSKAVWVDEDEPLVKPNFHFFTGHKDAIKALPLPGQLWAKGSRYVTVDRVEDGRVHYTGGSSGLRRFLNEYANVTNTVRATFTGTSPNFQQIKNARPEFGTREPVPPRPVLTSNRMQQMLGRALRPEPCPLNTATLNRLNVGDALGNWTQYRNTLGEKIRYANQRIKELSK